MDPRGNIYEDSPEKPVTAEDKARLEGYLKAKADANKEKLIQERLEALEKHEAQEAA